MNNPRVISFEQWLKENKDFVRQQQEACIVGHLEDTDPWWDTRVFIECYGCGRLPGQERTSLQKGCDCEDLHDWPLCECNGKSLYDKAVHQALIAFDGQQP